MHVNKQSATVIVGIAGGSASGKSTLALALKTSLHAHSHSCSVIGTDAYFRRGDESAPKLFWSLANEFVFDCNHIDSADNARLANDLDALLASPDSANVILVEGLMVLASPDIRERCDMRIYVDLEDDVRLARRLLRDISSNRGFSEPSKIIGYYLESARVGHARYVEPSKVYADFTVRGDAAFDRLAAMLIPAIEERLGRNKGEGE
jgi:uridine kinase